VTFSFVLAIVGGSFRLVVRAVLPAALVFILSACGGPAPSRAVSTHRLGGPGFTFSAPESWRVAHTQRGVVARSGGYLVSVTRFQLEKAYRPAQFDAATKELDRLASQLAAESGGTVTRRETVTVDGESVRAYRYSGKHAQTRIGFVLRDRSEFQLLCRSPPGAGADRDGACALLFGTFSAR
jgi:hypothetical protein